MNIQNCYRDNRLSIPAYFFQKQHFFHRWVPKSRFGPTACALKMPRFACFVNGCLNNCYKIEESRKYAFHRFPKDVWTRGKWNMACYLNVDYEVTENHRVCSLHFKSTDYCTQVGTKINLKPDSVPSIDVPGNKNSTNNKKSAAIKCFQFD